jgi:hypothetical protein
MKSFAAKALTLVLFVVGLVSVASPATADISFPQNSYWTPRLSVSYDNANPYLGDTVTFSATYDCIANGDESYKGIRAANTGVDGNQYNGDIGSPGATNGNTHSLVINFSQNGDYGFVIFTNCFIDASHQSWRAINSGVIVVHITDRPNFVGVPQNVTAFPHDSSAFVTWGIANRATSYLVTASPSGQTCTTTQNFCTVTGLTNGSQQTFAVTAMNGTPAENSTSPATTAVTINEPLQISGSVSSSTWKVGAMVTVTPLIVGVPTHTDLQWYRCDSVVPAMPAQPACTMIAGQSSSTYTLTSADLGKYVSAFIHVTNSNSDAMQTISNNRPTLAADAVVAPPVADSTGKPSVTDIPVREIPLLGGTTLVINGTNLSGVTSVQINGVQAVIVSKSETSLTIQVPATANKAGLVDLTITNAKGSVTSSSALSYVQSLPTVSKARVLSLTGFASSTVTLSAALKAKVKTFLLANKGYTKLACLGDVRGVKLSATQKAAAQARAKATCAYAKTVNSALFTNYSGVQSKFSGSIARLVNLTLTN